MGLQVMKGFHVLKIMEGSEVPPSLARGARFSDGFGNEFRMVFHKTDTAGIAVTRGGPVGLHTGYADGRVTADLSQSTARKVQGASMVSLTIAQTFAGVWHAVLVKGNLRDYKTGGAAMPLDGNGTNGYTAIDTIPWDTGCEQGKGILWSADNVWIDTIGVETEVIAGHTNTTEVSATPDSENFDWNV